MKLFLFITTFVLISASSYSQITQDDNLFDTTSTSIITNQKSKSGHIPTFENDNHSQRRAHTNHDVYRPIPNTTFLNELRKLRSIRNSYSKRLYAKRLINNYRLTVKHISAIANLMQGYSKLDILQFAYTRCIDPYNYTNLSNNLPFNMQQELEDYINYMENNFYYNPNDDDEYGYDHSFNIMSSQTFTDLKKTIQSTSFDETKLSTAKSIVKNSLLNTNQVIELCELFSFESSKLEFAQYAYNFTIDKQNYFKVNNVFDFDSSKTALNKTISQNAF